MESGNKEGFPVMSLSGMHQDALAFTLQKIFGQLHPSPPQQVVFVNVP